MLFFWMLNFVCRNLLFCTLLLIDCKLNQFFNFLSHFYASNFPGVRGLRKLNKKRSLALSINMINVIHLMFNHSKYFAAAPLASRGTVFKGARKIA